MIITNSYIIGAAADGPTAPNGDWLFANDPAIPTYNSNNPSSFSGSGALVIDGKTNGKSVASLGTDGFAHLIDIDGTNYTSIDITNMDLSDSRRCLIFIHAADGITITTRNNKYGTSNRDGETSNQFKKALVYNACKNCTIRSYGEWFDGPDGVVHLEECDGSDFDMNYPHISGVVSNGSDDGQFWKELNNIFMGRNGNITGRIRNLTCYAPNDGFSTTQFEDAFNLHISNGSAVTPFILENIHLWAAGAGQTGTAFQIGDGNYNGYNHINNATVIDWNGIFQFSSGHHHRVTNVKGYASETNPARGTGGYAVQIQRQGVDPGKLHDCHRADNTALWYYDEEDATPLITSRQVYYPAYGRDDAQVQGWPNHGECVGTCDINDNVAPTGSNNDWEYSAWANGQGKIDLFRESWKTFHYAGADGLTSPVDYSSPFD